MNLDATVDFGCFIGSNFRFELCKVRLFALAESTLRGTVLSFALSKGFGFGRLATRLGARRQDPFFGWLNKRCATGVLLGNRGCSGGRGYRSGRERGR